uniref:Putative secreted protein n=1 Tax=Ixodes scapularis TaxID=6945 RepID=A0A4D5REE1_IXOSC
MPDPPAVGRPALPGGVCLAGVAGAPTCCCWTNPPTTWTWRPSTPWPRPSQSLTEAWCSSVTTSGSSARWLKRSGCARNRL